MSDEKQRNMNQKLYNGLGWAFTWIFFLVVMLLSHIIIYHSNIAFAEGLAAVELGKSFRDWVDTLEIPENTRVLLQSCSEVVDYNWGLISMDSDRYVELVNKCTEAIVGYEVLERNAI